MARKQAAECPKCGKASIRLNKFYGHAVQLVEGARAGNYAVHCDQPGCGFGGTVRPEHAALLPLGKGAGVAL